MVHPIFPMHLMVILKKATATTIICRLPKFYQRLTFWDFCSRICKLDISAFMLPSERDITTHKLRLLTDNELH